MKKSIAIILAFSILLSNAGLALSTHFCGGMAVEHQLSFGFADVGCGMEESLSSCQNPSKTAEGFAKAPCCQDAHQLLQLEEPSEKAQSSLFKFQTQVTFAILTALVVYFFPKQGNHSSSFVDYTPPPLIQDIRVMFQVFRI
jgi:hypothetical protein